MAEQKVQLPKWMNEHMNALLKVSPKNPLDVSTIISMYPRAFTEKKAMMPEWYHIPSGNFEMPGFLVVPGASSWREMSDTRQILEIPISSVSVAESVIRDWMIGIMEVVLGHAQPGVFFLPGEWNLEQIKANETAWAVYNRAHEMQQNWFLALINVADSLWAQSNGNPLVISDLMRVAAELTGHGGKPWLKNFQTIRMINCPACSHMIMPGFPVCSNCRIVVDPVAFAKLGLSFAPPATVPIPVKA